MNKKKQFSKKLLVEGNDDYHVVSALSKKFEITEKFDIINCGGIVVLKQHIPILIKSENVDVLGILVDADINIKARWHEIKTILTNSDLTISEPIPATGLIIQNDINIKVGVWIMPNNNLNGMLEDFITFLVPKGDSLLPIVHSTLDEIENKKIKKYITNHKSKAIIHTLLAWQEDPGTPMGHSITKKYLNIENKLCLQFTTWLNNLYTD